MPALCTLQEAGKTQTKGAGLTAISTLLLSSDDYTPAQSLTWDGFLMTSADFQQSCPSYISLIRGLIAQISLIISRHPVDPLHSSPDIWAHPDVSELLKLEPLLSLQTFMLDHKEKKMIPKAKFQLNYILGFRWQTRKSPSYCCVLWFRKAFRRSGGDS